MTNPAYTDEDLRAEAARQLATLGEDPDFMGVGEQMEDAVVESTEASETPLTWTQLLVPDGVTYEAFDEPQRKIHDLINGAADVSEWAINLGADGLEPDGHTLQLGVDPGSGDQPRVRLHFAFHPDMADADRDRFVMRLTKAIAENL